METKNILAFDCGNSSYRLVLARFDGEKIDMEVVAREKNDIIRVLDYYYWDILKTYNFFVKNLKQAMTMVDRIDSIGVCTWGVDFALFDKRGNMLNNPLTYRNEAGKDFLEELSKKSQDELFFDTGILCNRINSVYLLSAIKKYMPELFNTADKLLMIPDILNYFLTGKMKNEPSELSTTQLFDVKNKKISINACEKFGINPNIFSEISTHGEVIGQLLPSIKEEIGLNYDIPVISVPSHDTASAVATIPTKEDEFVFISSGTWALIGAQLDEPIMEEAVIDKNFTNELGAFDKITLLKNCTGMFILEKIKKEYDLSIGKESKWDELISISSEVKDSYFIDVNNSRFFNPKNMSEQIYKFLKESGQYNGDFSWGLIVKVVQQSMACNYAITINELEEIIKREFDKLYIVGGGSLNKNINRLTSCYTGKKVITCGTESTSLGNAMAQLKYFDPELSASDMRDIIEKSIEVNEYKEENISKAVLSRYLKALGK